MLRILSFVALLLVAWNVNAVGSGPFSSLWVFGDSLSDSGNAALAQLPLHEPEPWTNLVPSFSYAQSGTFSDGDVWVQQLADLLGLPLQPSFGGPPNATNFALGGARTGLLPSIGLGTVNPGELPILNQAQFAGTLALDPNGLYVVYGGGNDVRAALEFLTLNPSQFTAAQSAMQEGAQNIAAAINALFNAGAKNFLVPNLPDVGLAPALIASGASALATSLIAGPGPGDDGFNEFLTSELSLFGSNNPSANIVTLDSFTNSQIVVGFPGLFGFTNATDACTLENGGTGCNVPSDYVFWDGLHPTTAAHQLTANAAYAAVVPLPAALWLMAGACGLLAGARRRARI